MSDDKPLHVLVAEAIGWTDVRPCGDIAAPWASGYEGHEPGWLPIVGRPRQGWEVVPRYDIEWSATGPLIERFRLSLDCDPDEEDPDFDPAEMWSAALVVQRLPAGSDGIGEDNSYSSEGPTPLIAACRLLTRLHDKGLLPRPKSPS